MFTAAHANISLQVKDLQIVGYEFETVYKLV